MIIIEENNCLKPYNSIWIITIRKEYLKSYVVGVLVV